MHAEARAVNALPAEEFFLARQPILGRDQHLVAFELLFRAAGEHDEAQMTNGAAATAAVISHASQLGMEQVVGDQLAFVNADEDVLMSDFVHFLPPHKVILEILETVKPTQQLLARVAELKQLGFKFALDDVVDRSADVDRLVELVDVVKVDLQGIDRAALPGLAAWLKTPSKKLLAEKVETVDEFEMCMELGFDYFQGYYFARPAILSGKKITPSELALLHLLELINTNADNDVIESAVKRDALVSLNLLRLVNTRAAGAGQRIESVPQALGLLGRRQLQRWLQILLYTAPSGTVEVNSPLLQMATTRGKLLELMTQKVRPGDTASADRAFTVGIISLADALFSMPMEQLVERLELAEDVREALLDRWGDFGVMLRVVELLESAAPGRALSHTLKQLGLTVKEIREIELKAFAWVRELAYEVH